MKNFAPLTLSSAYTWQGSIEPFPPNTYDQFKPDFAEGRWERGFNKAIKKLARPEGLEPPTLGSEDRCSIH